MLAGHPGSATSFHRGTNRFLTFAIPLLAVVTVAAAGSDERIVYALAGATVVAAACGIVLPSVSYLLDRFGFRTEPGRGTVRRAAIVTAVLLVVFAAIPAVRISSPLSIVLGVVLGAYAAAVAVLAVRVPAENDAGAAPPGFGATYLGAVVLAVMALGTLLVIGTKQSYAFHFMEQALRNLAAEQQARVDSTGVYSQAPPEGVDANWKGLEVAVRLTPDGWAARASAPQVSGGCAIYVGSTPEPPARTPGVIECARRHNPVERRLSLFVAALLASILLLLALGGGAKRRAKFDANSTA